MEKQKIRSCGRSSAEAEFMAMNQGIREGLWRNENWTSIEGVVKESWKNEIWASTEIIFDSKAVLA